MANILKKYNCFDCLQNINEAEHTLEELEAHIAGIHLGFYPYKCIDCLKMFPTKNLLTRHVPQSHHKNSFPVYYECTEEFRKMENELAAKIRKCISLKDEPAMYHPTVMLHSPHIDKPEPFGKLRRMLMKDYTSDGKQQEHLQCKLCDEIVPNVADAPQNHVNQKHAGIPLYSCMICPMTWTSFTPPTKPNVCTKLFRIQFVFI